MKQKVLETIKKFNLIKDGDKIVLGVSGGPDSISMLNILNEIKHEQSIKFEIYVAHVNHLIRKEAIDDEKYVERAINEFMALKNLSIKEIKYKLLSKGVPTRILDEYIEKNTEELEEYEQKSANNIALKKSVNMEETEIKQYLMKKGYREENIRETLEKLEE